MTDRDIFLAASGCSTVRHIDTDASYGKFASSASVECDATSLTMGSAITIDAGYTDQHQNIFEGFVSRIEYLRPDNLIRLTCYDRLILASNFFIVADNPDAPFQRNNISTPALITDLLALASITTDLFLDDPGFTFGTNADGARFNLQSVADAINFISQVTGYTIYAGTSGHIHFVSRKPYVVGGDTSVHSFTSGSTSPNIIDISYSASTDKSRNRVVVYGLNPLTSTATASNPYLVVDQTVCIANPLLDTQALCDGTASVNLTLLNRLTESYELTVVGDPSIKARDICDITDSFVGASGRLAFVYKVAHSVDARGGFISSLTCTP